MRYKHPANILGDELVETRPGSTKGSSKGTSCPDDGCARASCAGGVKKRNRKRNTHRQGDGESMQGQNSHDSCPAPKKKIPNFQLGRGVLSVRLPMLRVPRG